MESATIDQARKILEREKPSEIAARLGVKCQSNIAQIRDGKRNLTEKMAARIVEAFAEKPKKKAEPVTVKSGGKKAESITKKSKSKELNLSNARTADAFLNEIEKGNQLDQLNSMARHAISKILQEEALPALNEKLGRFLEKVKEGGFSVADMEGKQGRCAEAAKKEATIPRAFEERVFALEKRVEEIEHMIAAKEEPPRHKWWRKR